MKFIFNGIFILISISLVLSCSNIYTKENSFYEKYKEIYHVKATGNHYEIAIAFRSIRRKPSIWGMPQIKGDIISIYVQKVNSAKNGHVIKLFVPGYHLDAFYSYENKNSLDINDSLNSKMDHELIFNNSKIEQILFYDTFGKIDGPVFQFNKKGTLKHIFLYRNDTFEKVVFTNFPKKKFSDTVLISKVYLPK